ncbi:hypothetical protein FOJ82_14545 [Tessaracoccus rhinocerotis]|uniref:DUF6458 domain-containing protein n=1 Tax=Tessaracoccus rhinocerotis TaxID=1689449 RepID=A0A553JX96_9ACTN|nr:DUF6458 family protein [Tessaracoccus rhinocerotis]TRY17064.1 hypothetical protein FOJ82_14545 [Tessaracoccus rhinocerotis]
MRIGTSIFLLALGAILAFAISEDTVSFFNINIAGYILMACGVFGVIWSLIASQRHRSTETRVMNDPNTGDQVTRSETRDGI